MASTIGHRIHFKSFWDKYSDRPDMKSMMLNQNAEDLEQADTEEVLTSLPNINGKDAVDIGAGIGRFTAVLAQTAKHVLSTDFIEEFIKKNKENNGHLENVDFAVGDAVHLDLHTNSVDFVFTNWLMMYMNDKEVIEFLLKALSWLRAGGYLHLRESCSEPSTGAHRSSNGVSLHDANAINPTSYRYSSLYINIIRCVRWEDEESRKWKFDLLWSTSMHTYVERMHNWRQVHWLLKKVPAESTDPVLSFNDLLGLFSHTWNEEQRKWDKRLDSETFVWTDKLMESALSTFPPSFDTAFVYTPRRLSSSLHINSHFLAERFSLNVWNVEGNPMYYRTSLTKANTNKDTRVRFAWHPSLTKSIEYWKEREVVFDTFIATELLSSEEDKQELANVKNILDQDAKVVFIEPIPISQKDSIVETLSSNGFDSITVTDVSTQALEEIQRYHKEHSLEMENYPSDWIIVTARV